MTQAQRTTTKYPVHDGATILTTTASVYYSAFGGDKRVIRGELAVYTAIDNEPAAPDCVSFNFSCSDGERNELQVPLEAVDSFLDLITTLVRHARRDHVLPAEA